MKTFKLDHSGDVVITNNQIELVEGVELIAQTLRQVIGTNLGEWFGDEEEGVDFQVILTKNPNYDLIRDTINTAVNKVADSLNVAIETDNFTFEAYERNLDISFTLTVEEESTSLTLTL